MTKKFKLQSQHTNQDEVELDESIEQPVMKLPGLYLPQLQYPKTGLFNHH